MMKTLTAIRTTLSRIPQDGLLHFLGGLLIAQVTLPFSLTWALALPPAIGAAKEWWDETPDINDFAATCIGGLVGFLLAAVQ